MNNVSSKKLQRNNDIELFRQYHLKYPTHGYRWLSAKIKLDLGQTMSDNYAQRCCAFAGIRSVSKRCKYAKPGKKYKIYPNLLLADLAINQPYQVVVSDMTAFWVNKDYYELTLYMDLFNNEIIAYDVSTTKGDRTTYINGLNELLPLYNITHSMSRAGTPTDNGAMESINGWLKEELFNDFKIKEKEDPINCIKEYIHFFNEQRPSYSLNYLTPKQFKEFFTP